jgi:nicotinamide riboside kinase
MRIAIIGTHSTGKTELVNLLQSRLKGIGKDVVVIKEVTRLCPFPVNRNTTFEAQSWILLEHLKQEKEKSGCDVLLSDRCLVDHYMYMVRKFPEESKSFLKTVLESAKRYDHIFKTVPSSKIEENGFRDTDPKFRDDIERLLLEFLERHKIHFTELPQSGAAEFIIRGVLDEKIDKADTGKRDGC